MSTDPHAAPTDEEWAAIDARFWEASRTWDAAQHEYFTVHFKAWQEAYERWKPEMQHWIRMGALRQPVRDYVIDQLSRIIHKRPPTAKKIDPHHRPADVQQVLDDLIAEGKVRRAGKGYEWVSLATIETSPRP